MQLRGALCGSYLGAGVLAGAFGGCLMGGSRGFRPVDVDDACRVCVIGHGARLSGPLRRAAWCVARAGGGKRSAKNAAQVLRAHLGGGPGVIVRGTYMSSLGRQIYDFLIFQNWRI